ncbi:hypothetical protein GLOTRDRAFT_127323 [Gloeophyllum trabeum ATCC 11539]|uniref:Uncharacterized protein n=1 Tax=Gloeophyllum trabeum (strain ATCC 11539 / FP-39264 / Madison 617) TaxID=670483 RepID=S7QC58_GLOTA|nr:uncharacterized protein GLOTRDRAFT_127323 [Gloeophyllum trabeum ATCC 11539]EPQ56937.1 hypothetical protein GLOTRDRAFT_127323 [Gloeophyllum trabeum ATCC 11539]
MVRSFIRGANLRRWLSRIDCPAAIKLCKDFFDKAFGSKHDKHRDSRLEDLPIQQFPAPLQNLTQQQWGPLCSYLRFRRIMYSSAAFHTGNSLIFFYPMGGSENHAVPGSIQYIYRRAGSLKFAVRRQMQAPQEYPDPFRKWRDHYPAEVYSLQLADDLEEVDPTRVLCHFARFPLTDELAVVLMLSQAYKSVVPVPGCEPLSQPLLAAGGPPPAIEWLADAATGGPSAARLYTGRSRISKSHNKTHHHYIPGPPDKEVPPPRAITHWCPGQQPSTGPSIASRLVYKNELITPAVTVEPDVRHIQVSFIVISLKGYSRDLIRNNHHFLGHNH